MTIITQYVRAMPRSIVDGCAALRDMLLWGTVYPRSIDLATLRLMRKRGAGA
jgi:hypothetical protein